MNAYFLGVKTLMLSGTFNWTADDIKAQLVDAAVYSPTVAAAPDADHFVAGKLSDIPAGARIGAAVSLTGKSVAGRNFKAANITFPGVAGTTAEWCIFYKNSGVESTSELCFGYDTVSGLPLTPNGLDVVGEIPAAGLGAL